MRLEGKKNATGSGGEGPKTENTREGNIKNIKISVLDPHENRMNK